MLASLVCMSHKATIAVPAPWRPVRGRPAIPERHTRKCRICRHPQRAAIEHAFLHWHSPERIARDYRISSASMIYRHVHATGLFHRRIRLLRHSLERIIELSDDCLAAADMIIRAVTAYSRLPENAFDDALPPAPYADPPDWTEISNREPTRVENDATR
jgi:hypothetical protein